MDIAQVSVVLRERSASEALDLGIAMGRLQWKTCVQATLLLGIPLWLIANATFASSPWAAIMVLWWLKPVLECISLEVISRGFFGVERSPRSHLRHATWPSPASLLSQLTWRRLSLWRSYVAPVEQLEGLNGTQRAERCKSLGRSMTGHAATVTVGTVICELCLWSSFYTVASFLLPEDLEVSIGMYDYARSGFAWAAIVSNALLFATFLCVMPFYVSMGFCLYIQRRVELEAWDIELAFRQMAARLQGERAPNATKARG